MFKHIGKKIKGLAVFWTVLGIAASVIGGFVLFGWGERGVVLGVLVMLLGSVLSWVSSFLLYGFGELVENSEKLAQARAMSFDKKDAGKDRIIEDSFAEKQQKKIKALDNLHAQGLISDVEYQKKIENIKKESAQ